MLLLLYSSYLRFTKKLYFLKNKPSCLLRLFRIFTGVFSNFLGTNRSSELKINSNVRECFIGATESRTSRSCSTSCDLPVPCWYRTTTDTWLIIFIASTQAGSTTTMMQITGNSSLKPVCLSLHCFSFIPPASGVSSAYTRVRTLIVATIYL